VSARDYNDVSLFTFTSSLPALAMDNEAGGPGILLQEKGEKFLKKQTELLILKIDFVIS
jgi:hypothetical protein